MALLGLNELISLEIIFVSIQNFFMTWNSLSCNVLIVYISTDLYGSIYKPISLHNAVGKLTGTCKCNSFWQSNMQTTSFKYLNGAYHFETGIAIVLLGYEQKRSTV